jgi:PncC family amidohydrolase
MPSRQKWRNGRISLVAARSETRTRRQMEKPINESTDQGTARPTRSVVDRGPHPLAVELGHRLQERGLTLALAESCTGGLIGDLITDVPGSSDYFLGGAVTYANSAKEHILGVKHDTLLAHGAVSAETAAEMAQGARRLFGADVAVSVTGIAGPGGDMPGKPVGLVHIHLSAIGTEIGERHVWDADRMGNKRLSAEAVLRLALRYVAELRNRRPDK